MMKILYYDFSLPYLLIDANYPAGGAAVEWLSWINGLSENGVNVGVLTFKGAVRLLKDKNVNVEIVETYELNKGNRVLRYFFYRIFSLFKGISKNNPDVIIMEVAGLNVGLIAIYASVKKIPFFYRGANDMDFDERIKKRLTLFQRAFFYLGMKLSKGIICQNKYQEKMANKKFKGIPTTVIHNPFSMYRIKNERNVFSERKYIAWLGIFQYQKNLPALYEIAKNNPEINFKIAGKPAFRIDKDTKNALEKLKELRNVEFVGFVKRNEVQEFLRKAIYLLNTSRYEGFSNTFLEAFSVGTPVITTENVNPDNIISEFRLGYVFESYKKISSNLKKIVVSKKIDEIRIRCINYVKNKHNSKELSKQMITFISHISKI